METIAEDLEQQRSSSDLTSSNDRDSDSEHEHSSCSEESDHSDRPEGQPETKIAPPAKIATVSAELSVANTPASQSDGESSGPGSASDKGKADSDSGEEDDEEYKFRREAELTFIKRYNPQKRIRKLEKLVARLEAENTNEKVLHARKYRKMEMKFERYRDEKKQQMDKYEALEKKLNNPKPTSEEVQKVVNAWEGAARIRTAEGWAEIKMAVELE